MSNTTLHLNLKKQWFDMILSGVKTEEYREIKPYWINRLAWHGAQGITGYDTITFSNGYSKERREMIVDFIYLRKSYGNPEWGAMPGVKYYTLGLGEIISTTRCDLKLPSCDVLVNCPHHPYDRDQDDFGRTKCLNCNEYLPQYDDVDCD